MQRTAPVFRLLHLCVGALLALWSPAAHCGNLFKLTGYDYINGAWTAGSTLTVVGRLTPPLSGPSGFTYPIAVDFTANEYTFVITGLVIATHTQTTSGSTTIRDTIFNNGALLKIYEDPSKNSSYGTSPPNASAPSTFQNGTLRVTGTLSNARMTLYNSSGSFWAGVLFSGQGFAPETWNAVISIVAPPFSSAPAGYAQDFSGKIEPVTPPVSLESKSWEGVKNLYR